MVIAGALLAPVFARRKRSEKYQNKYGAEYDRTVETTGSEKKAQAELAETTDAC